MGAAILNTAGVLYKVLPGEALPQGLTPYLFRNQFQTEKLPFFIV